MKRVFRWAFWALIGFLCAACMLLFSFLYACLPDYRGRKTVPGLNSPVSVLSDRYAIPTVKAKNRVDAFCALGYITARDRLFQLELFRRAAQGRLAEVFGRRLLDFDRQQRVFDFNQVAVEIFRQLPGAQREVLLAYARGVNAYIQQSLSTPIELLLLGVTPSPWRPEDCLLVALNLFQSLNMVGHKEAMLSVMQEKLPAEVVAFLTPDSDFYSAPLIGGPESRGPPRKLPEALLNALYREGAGKLDVGARIEFEAALGSNAWVVGAAKTADRRAILANDMHLPLLVPNLWYRARLEYRNRVLSGITLPGIPLLISGSNNHVAWGFTNALADVIDLVTLEINPENENEYRGPDGWLRFRTRNESIRVRGGRNLALRLRHTIWGPVSPHPLLGKMTAIRWSALDPAAVDLAWIDLDRIKDLDRATALFNRAGSPVLNVMLSDSTGNIAWTLGGKIPKRRQFDGSVSLDWRLAEKAWDGYLSPKEMPRVRNPQSGFLVTANNRVIGKDFPYPIGQNFANGYRAWRIRRQLDAMAATSETELLRLQGDTRSEFYDFYCDLALSVLSEQRLRENPRLNAIQQYLLDWNGRADANSKGIGVLFGFRRRLAGEIILPLLRRCYAADPNFYYSWFNMDTPLRQILTARSAQVLPNPKIDRDWDALILRVLLKTVETLEQRHQVDNINQLDWSEINSVRIAHPFSRALPLLGRFLDQPKLRLPGCTFCINVLADGYGVTERLVVSPGHHEDAFLVTPGGQSGNPLSPHYRDLHGFWAKGLALSLEPHARQNQLHLVPE